MLRNLTLTSTSVPRGSIYLIQVPNSKCSGNFRVEPSHSVCYDDLNRAISLHFCAYYGIAIHSSKQHLLSCIFARTPSSTPTAAQSRRIPPRTCLPAFNEVVSDRGDLLFARTSNDWQIPRGSRYISCINTIEDGPMLANATSCQFGADPYGHSETAFTGRVYFKP